MLSIIVNHLQWYPSGYDVLAARGTLYVSAAEGFFLLSGIVLGIVRGRKLLDQPFQKAATLLLKRGVLLYVTCVLLTMAFTFVGWWFFMDNPGIKPGIRPTSEPLGDVILGILSFKYLYGWADFLRLYAIFIVAAPFALWLIRKGLWYVLMLISAGLWLLFPWALENGQYSGEILMILSWQFIFFAGFVIGFYWEKLTEKWAKLSTKTRRLILYPILAIATITLIGNILIEFMHLLKILPSDLASWRSALAPYFSKTRLSIARLVLFTLWFTLGFWLFKKFERPIMKYAGWILLPFGQNSLYVYILHAVFLFLAHMVIAPYASPNPIISFIGTTLIIGVIYYATKKEFLFKVIPR